MNTRVENNRIYAPNTPQMKGVLALKERLLDVCDCMRMVHIGAFYGEPTIIFSTAFLEVNVVDVFQGRDSTYINIQEILNEFRKNVEYIKNINYIHAASLTAVSDFPDDSLDFIYLDGDVGPGVIKQDIVNWYPKIKMDGYIGGRNYKVGKRGHTCDSTKMISKLLYPIDKSFSGGLFIKSKIRRELL